MLRFIWDSEQNWIRINGFMCIYIMVNQKQTWGYLEGGSNSPVNSLSLWNSNLKAIPQTGSVVAQLFRSNVIPEISWWNRVWRLSLWRVRVSWWVPPFSHPPSGGIPNAGDFSFFRTNLWEKLSIPEEKEKLGEPVLSAMLTLSATFEKLKTGDRDIVFTQVRLQEVKGLWPNPRFNLGNGCVHVVWMTRSVRSVCNKRRHVVVFAKQALIADAAPVFLRFAWPAVAFQMVHVRRVFTAAREEITGWLEQT